MTDAELYAWWPTCGVLVIELRRIGQDAVADQLVTATLAGATSTEILGEVGVVLRKNRKLRASLNDDGIAAWKSVKADVVRAFSPSFLGYHWGWKKKKL